MAAYIHVSDNEDIRLKCDTHDNDLLPLFCKDCNCHLCIDCVPCDHTGHNICKVSEVVDFHKQELKEILCGDTSSQFLAQRLSHLQEQQKSLAVHTECLLQNALDREEEIIERLRIWRRNIIDKIVSFRETHEKHLRDDQMIISALLQHHEKSLEPEKTELELSYLCFQGKRLLGEERCLTSDKDIANLYGFNIGPSGEDLYDAFGEFRYGSEEDSSSDSVSLNSSNEEEKEEFCDCEKSQGHYQVCNKSIENIVPVNSLRFFLLSLSNVYLCAFHGSYIDMKLILSNVWQIALIPSTGDILSIMSDRKRIKRISNENIITTFVVATGQYEGANSGGDNAYACASYKWDTNWTKPPRWSTNIHLLSEFGVILKTFEHGLSPSFGIFRILKTQKENKFYLSNCGTIQLFDAESGKLSASYSGAVGRDPSSRFNLCNMISDHNNNLLLAVKNDNAIHLLDKSLKFQKLLLTEEDGLRSPSCLALDTFGYLWVGCEDGQMHIVNYQYLLMTDRLSRLKSKR